MLVSTFHSNWWSGKYFKCLAGSKCLFGSSCSAHLKTTFLTVFTTRTSTYVKNAAVMCNIMLIWKSVLIFLVFRTMLNLHLIVYITSFLTRFFVNFSFDSENASHRIISFGLFKYSTVFLIKILWKPADKNFLVMRFISKLK